jgi:PHP family Zn ribbon phosphoesterase
MTPLVIEKINLLVCWKCKCQIRKEEGEGKKCESCGGKLEMATKDREDFLELSGEGLSGQENERS